MTSSSVTCGVLHRLAFPPYLALQRQMTLRYRERRCMIPGKLKPLIPCPEKNSCANCPYPQYRDNQLPDLSWDQYVDAMSDVSQVDPGFARVENRMAIAEAVKAIAAQNPKFAQAIVLKEYEMLNQEFHQSIWRAADNHQLTGYLMDLWNGPSVGHGDNAAQHHYESSTHEHIAILQAIRDGKPEEAKSAMTRHISRSMANILEHRA